MILPPILELNSLVHQGLWTSIPRKSELGNVMAQTTYSNFRSKLEDLDERYYKNWIYEIIVTYRNGELPYKLEHVKIEEKIVRL